ncbi:hypothetical protein [Bythopirellula polymerisocia]|uniref:Uncharacterized protein n=1 Tax=Bythopirellula polymerisocia TaxID=2528003 RepID=A0A5C6CWA0_9BACT|nr:hypothetical protein [Bythopirellula polymerisocia]TWU27681.1 hypothetical protein Pla144_24580 [Bythopirellula polymerisocia]
MSTQTLESSSQQVQKPDARPGEWQYYAAKGVDRMQHVVHDNAGSSMLIALASGLGVGILIGTAIGGSRQSAHWWNRETAENMGNRFLSKIGAMVPDALSERIHR